MPAIRAAVVDDKEAGYRTVVDNLGLVFRRMFEMEVSFEYFRTVEEILRDLLDRPNHFELIITDLLFPPVFRDDAPESEYDARGLEVIEHAAAIGRIVTVALTIGSLTRHPELQREAEENGADIFRFRTAIVARGGRGWPELASEIHAKLLQKALVTSSKFKVKLDLDHGAGADPRRVFVVHGRNRAARDAMFDFLRALKLDPVEWEDAVRETGHAAPYVGDVLEAGFNMCRAAVVIFSPDDIGKLQDEFIEESDGPYEAHLSGQARQNVVFEAGMALAKFPERTILVEVGRVRPFSDIFGRLVLRMFNKPAARNVLASRLETAGCAVNRVGERWLSVGDFDVNR